MLDDMLPQNKVLFVDDDPGIVNAMRRSFRSFFAVGTATSGAEGLRTLEREGPFGVVVSDMRMPGMDGVQFLREVKEKYPDTVRALLTGYADLDSAIAAVNEGSVFRFVTKPASPQQMTFVLEACFDQHALITAERELLEHTLRESVQALVEMLSLACPDAFGRTARIRRYVTELARILQLPSSWQRDLAALLSQIGTITIPNDTIARMCAGKPLSPEEQKMVSEHPHVAYELIRRIPRLEGVAEMVRDQADTYSSRASESRNGDVTGSDLLKAATEFDLLVMRHANRVEAIRFLAKRGECHPRVLAALAHISPPEIAASSADVRIEVLRHGAMLCEDVRGNNGLLLVAKGQVVTDLIKLRLLNQRAQGNFGGVVRVTQPTPQLPLPLPCLEDS